MRLLKVRMRQCEKLRSIGADSYLGFRIASCPERIEHVVVSSRRVSIFSKRCDDCVLAKLVRATHVVGTPIIAGDSIVFLVNDNRHARRLLAQHSDDIVEVEEVDYREAYLTKRQRQVLRLLASGEASNVSRVARKLGISKPAALKLVKNSIRKIVERYS
ncbi:MAG: hypothetical protein F7C33_06410 [Desulfurococcales archaeon]|nr:hypothetical protein [Desulfurococcales archaeon]